MLNNAYDIFSLLKFVHCECIVSKNVIMLLLFVVVTVSARIGTSIRLPYCHFPTFIDKESMMICMAVMCIGIIDVLKLLFSSGGMTLVKSST